MDEDIHRSERKNKKTNDDIVLRNETFVRKTRIVWSIVTAFVRIMHANSLVYSKDKRFEKEKTRKTQN